VEHHHPQLMEIYIQMSQLLATISSLLQILDYRSLQALHLIGEKVQQVVVP
jgi:hypothetical protein